MLVFPHRDAALKRPIEDGLEARAGTKTGGRNMSQRASYTSFSCTSGALFLFREQLSCEDRTVLYRRRGLEENGHQQQVSSSCFHLGMQTTIVMVPGGCQIELSLVMLPCFSNGRPNGDTWGHIRTAW